MNLGRTLHAWRAFALVFAALLASLPPRAAEAEDYLNIRINQDATTELQNEQQIAVSPVDPNNMVTVWRDFRLGYRKVAWGYTHDGGYTWTEGGLFEEPHYVWQSDPGVVAARNGDFYAVILSFVSTSQPNGLYVYRSTDGGASWGPPLEVVNQVPGVFEDKEFLACDRTGGAHDGNLYVAWARFGSTVDVLFKRSTNGGAAWGPAINVDDDNGSQFPIPVVGRSGEVYVAWSNWYDNQIRFDVSTDGGVTFGADRTVANVYSVYNVLNGGIDAYASPHMDADLTDGAHAGRLYLAFMDRRGGSGDFDIWVVSSDDDGAHWPTPVRVNDDPMNNGRDQFLPWLTVDDIGVVTIVFLDRRHDPANWTYHCWLAQSSDGGVTWSPNVQVSTVPSDPSEALRTEGTGGTAAAVPARGEPPLSLASVSRAGLLGEYIGVASAAGYPTPIWTDIRNGHQDTYGGYALVKTVVGGGAPTAASGPILSVAPHPIRIGYGFTVRSSQATGTLRAYDIGGRLVATRSLTSRLSFWPSFPGEGRSLAPGVYFLRLESPGGTATTRIVAVE